MKRPAWLDRFYRPGNRKLTNEQAQEIRFRLDQGELQQTLAQDFGVSQSTVSKISVGQHYRDTPRQWASTKPPREWKSNRPDYYCPSCQAMTVNGLCRTADELNGRAE